MQMYWTKPKYFQLKRYPQDIIKLKKVHLKFLLFIYWLVILQTVHLLIGCNYSVLYTVVNFTAIEYLINVC